jgi:hypothetical protein
MTFRIALVALPSFLLLVAGCQEDRMFKECAFDDSLNSNCSLADPLTCTNYSCAVADHPDCVDLMCLSFEGAQPRCTHDCLTNDDCPSGSLCTAYALNGVDQKMACVQVEDQEKELFVSCGTEPAVCDTVGADLCLPVLGDVCSRQCSNPCGSGDACTEYNGDFFCLTSCKATVTACSADEVCVPYVNTNTKWCLPKCDPGSEGCVTADGLSFLPPGDTLSCNPHQGCPGRSFCLRWEDQGYFCMPCEYSITQF